VLEKTASLLKEISVNRYHSIYCDREVFAKLGTHSGTYPRRLIYSGLARLSGCHASTIPRQIRKVENPP
jgi:hypothetical protein